MENIGKPSKFVDHFPRETIEPRGKWVDGQGYRMPQPRLTRQSLVPMRIPMDFPESNGWYPLVTHPRVDP